MKLTTSRFGEIDIAEEKVIQFPEGLPGLEELRQFALITTEETEPFHWFQAIDAGDVALAVIDPYKLFPDYQISVPESVLADMEMTDDAQMLVLTVAVVPREFQNMTTNLVSPIIINSAKNLGRQLILENSAYLIRQPIYDLLQKYVAGGGSDAGTDAQA